MAIAAKISAAELTAQVTDRFVDKHFEARLINAPGTTYIPGTTNDTTFLSFEVTPGHSGYQRQVISYNNAAVGTYADDGIALDTRATVFAHDGVGNSIDFSHVALVWSGGNVTALSTPVGAPSAGVDNTYTNIPIDSTSGSGVGLTVDLTIANSGASASDFTLAVRNAGYGYAAAEVLTILDGTLAGLGAINAGDGNLSFTVSTATAAGTDQILSVAQTSAAVSLSGGNEAAFYWNLKQFGYYSVT